MKRLPIIIILFLGSFFLSGCSLKKSPSAIQINSSPSSGVFVNGKSSGMTPYTGNDYKEGEIVVKLIPDSTGQALVPWEGKLKLNAGVLTLIEREFGISDSMSSGQILSLEKIKDPKSASVSIVSDPDSTLVKIDGESRGFSPLSLDKISAGEHEILISKEGFSERRVRAKAVNGYRLIVNVKLAQATVEITPTPTIVPSGPTPKATVTPKTNKVTPVPTGSTVRITPTVSPGSVSYVTIKETPTGWLRVRNSPGTSAAEVARVNPGEKYLLLEEKSGWYKIQYSEGKEGWISATYATKE